MLSIGVLGYGTVGSGVVEVLQTNQSLINQRAGDDIEVKYILDLRDFPGDPIQDKIVHDFQVILQDTEVQIIAEAMGGVEPAYTFVKSALLAGKSVVTSNKELVAKHGPELSHIAEEKDGCFLYEASVGGGIPIIRPLHVCLSSDEICEISGILNGTTNYMLSKMASGGLGFDQVLKDAQDRGYAEANPAADVEGYDACRKIAILSALAFDGQVDFEEITTEGITKISDTDMVYAAALGKAIKLVGNSKKIDGKVYAIVAPVMLDSDNPLFGVNDVMNAVLVKGNTVGELMFYGSGAGKLPTASAVVTDIVECAKYHVQKRQSGHTPQTVQDMRDAIRIAPHGDASRAFFVRMAGQPGQWSEKLMEVFGAVKIIQLPQYEGEFAFTTESIPEKDFEEKLAQFEGVKSKIRLSL